MEYDFKKAYDRMIERRRQIILQQGSSVDGLSKIEPQKEDKNNAKTKKAIVQEMNS